MKILVVGGCGYIGSALVPYLARAGHDVDTCDIVGKPNLEMSYQHLSGWGLIAPKYDTIIMLAGKSSVAAAEKDRAESFRENLTDLVEFAMRLRPDQRFIYASSASVYAVKREQFHNCYDFTKFAADAALKLLRPENTWALRFGTVCGASPNIRLDLMINRMVWSALTRGYVEVANPQVRRPILAMADLLRGIGKIIDGKVPAGIHNLASFNRAVGQIGHGVSEYLDVDLKTMPSSRAYDFEMKASDWSKPFETITSIVDDLIANHGEQWKKEKKDDATHINI